MAILDAALLFDDNVALTTSRDSTNTIDFSQMRDIGTDDTPLRVEFRFTVPVPIGTMAIVVPLPPTATIAIGFYTSSDNVSFVLLQQWPAIAASAYTASAPWGPMRLLPVPSGIRRYAKLSYTITGGPLTQGNILAGLVDEPEYNTRQYPKSFVA